MKGISALLAFRSSIHNFRRRFHSREATFLRAFDFRGPRAVGVARGDPRVLCKPRLGRMGKGKMVVSQAETLRKAIENLIDAKLHDALSRPGGLERLTAHRLSGVASFDIRNAERKLQQTLAEILSAETVNS
jgi:hypothetical protein